MTRKLLQAAFTASLLITSIQGISADKDPSEKSDIDQATELNAGDGTRGSSPESDTSPSKDVERLSTITIEGRYDRQGAIALQPGTGGQLDAADLLKRVPGGNVARNGPLTGLPQYRGSSGNQINVSVDGMDLKEVGPNSMDTSLSYTPKSMTKSMKVYRGLAPVSSGIETLGGTIQTESRRGEYAAPGEIETHGFATAGYSWVNSGRYAGVNASVANENNRLFFNGTYEKGLDYKFTGSKTVRPSQYERATWSAGYGFQMDGHEAGLSYDRKSVNNTGTPSLPMDILYIHTDVANVNYSGEFSNGYRLDFTGFYQGAQHEMDNYTLRPVPRPGGSPRFRNIHTDLEGGGYRAMLTIPEVVNGDLRFGVDGDLANHNADVRDPTNAMFSIINFNEADRNRYATFLEWDGKFNESWGMEVGLRYNRIEMNAGRVSTSIPAPPAQALANEFNSSARKKENNNVDGLAVIRYKASESLDMEFGFASKTRAPSYQQRYLWIPLETTGGLADGRVYVGDINLRSERSYETEFALDWHTDTYYFTPGIYYRYVADYIQGVPATDPRVRMVAGAIQPGGPGPLQFANINAQFYGIDFEAGYRFTDWLRFDGILSYVRGTRVGSVSDNLYRIAPLNGRGKLTAEYQDWMGFFEFVGAARQYDVSRFNGEQQTAGYGIMNLRIQYQPHYQYVNGLTLAFGIDNLSDKDHTDHLNGLNRALNPDVRIGNKVPNPGRNFYATVSYDW